jgi:hypothetical protein
MSPTGAKVPAKVSAAGKKIAKVLDCRIQGPAGEGVLSY